VHYTLGGLIINKNSEVLNKNNEVIKGLYAAGEVTGGIQGVNRLVGNGLLESVVFGKIAAECA